MGRQPLRQEYRRPQAHPRVKSRHEGWPRVSTVARSGPLGSQSFTQAVTRGRGTCGATLASSSISLTTQVHGTPPLPLYMEEAVMVSALPAISALYENRQPIGRRLLQK